MVRTAVKVRTNRSGPHVVRGLTGVISGQSCKHAINRKYKLSGRRNCSANDLGNVVNEISQRVEPYTEFTTTATDDEMEERIVRE